MAFNIERAKAIAALLNQPTDQYGGVPQPYELAAAELLLDACTEISKCNDIITTLKKDKEFAEKFCGAQIYRSDFQTADEMRAALDRNEIRLQIAIEALTKIENRPNRPVRNADFLDGIYQGVGVARAALSDIKLT